MMTDSAFQVEMYVDLSPREITLTESSTIDTKTSQIISQSLTFVIYFDVDRRSIHRLQLLGFILNVHSLTTEFFSS